MELERPVLVRVTTLLIRADYIHSVTLFGYNFEKKYINRYITKNDYEQRNASKSYLLKVQTKSIQNFIRYYR